jgi:type II secretory pathway pseudopilin PulG
MVSRRVIPSASERGFMMVALLVLMSVMAITMAAMLPAWNTMARREREAELVFRGEQYARAITLFQRKYAGAYPPSVDTLINEHVLRKKYKDPITNDDFRTISVGDAISLPGQTSGTATVGRGGTVTTGRDGITINTPGAARQPQTSASGRAGTAAGGRGSTGGPGGRIGGGGIMGVTSTSDAASFRLYKGADHYNQWLFIATPAATPAGGRGAPTPGAGTRGGPAGPTGRGGRATAPGPRGNPFSPPGPTGPAAPGGGARGRGRF